MDQHTWHTFIEFMILLGGAGMSFLLYTLVCGSFHRKSAKRWIEKLNHDLKANKKGLIKLDDAILGQLKLVFPKYRLLSLWAVKIVLEIVPRNPRRPFAVRVQEQQDPRDPTNFFPWLRDSYKKLEKNYLPTDQQHLFWTLMNRENRRFILKHEVEIGTHQATWLLTTAHPLFSFSLLLLQRRFKKNLPIWQKIVRQALDTKPFLPLADLLANERDKRIRRLALFYWMTARPYHPKLHQRLKPPAYNATAESMMLWLYCGGVGNNAMWERLMAPNNTYHVALLTCLLERLPPQQKIQQNFKALEYRHLARNASCLLMQMQDPVVVPHLIAFYCENRQNLELLTGLCLPQDTRAGHFLREVLAHGRKEERVRAAYELAKCGNEEDLIFMATVKNNADFHLKRLLELPVLNLRVRLGVDGAAAGLLTVAEVPNNVGELSKAEFGDLAVIAPPKNASESGPQK